jgi:hypothetical protein
MLAMRWRARLSGRVIFSFLRMRRFQKGADRGRWRCDSLEKTPDAGPGLKKD